MDAYTQYLRKYEKESARRQTSAEQIENDLIAKVETDIELIIGHNDCEELIRHLLKLARSTVGDDTEFGRSSRVLVELAKTKAIEREIDRRLGVMGL